MESWRTWRAATSEALYGPRGFFRTQAPADHFRTSVHVSTAFAEALARLARDAGLVAVVDVGAGRGELLTALHAVDPDLALTAVEIAERPADLPDALTWAAGLPDEIDGLVIANEWLDDVPVDVVEVDPHGLPRRVEVDVATGRERLADPVAAPDAAWLDTWWPLDDAPSGSRAEVGRPRDDTWADLVRRLRRGLAVAVDYGHVRAARPALGTLTGYRDGRQVSPVPDGSCDITSYVAMDSIEAAGERAGVERSLLTPQRDALRRLGLSGARPPLTLAHSDPTAYLAALSRATETAELLAAGGLGDFHWLVQSRGVGTPGMLQSG